MEQNLGFGNGARTYSATPIKWKGKYSLYYVSMSLSLICSSYQLKNLLPAVLAIPYHRDLVIIEHN
jgi:hypothetical protein